MQVVESAAGKRAIFVTYFDGLFSYLLYTSKLILKKSLVGWRKQAIDNRLQSSKNTQIRKIMLSLMFYSPLSPTCFLVMFMLFAFNDSSQYQ